MFNFNEWFTGFSDAESSFSIIPCYEPKSGKLLKFSFTWKIGLHIDDIEVLKYIQEKLGIGKISINREQDECKLAVSSMSDIRKLIAHFDKYKLNTTKYLDYVAFKEAHNLYFNRKVFSTELQTKLLELKNSMNTNRTDFNLPADHIKITKSWLLGLLEGDGSFHLYRGDIQAVIGITLTEIQLPVIEKIKEFLINDLGLDWYSKIKIRLTSIIAINFQKARTSTSKSSVNLKISNIYLLYNYLIPYFADVPFLTKKGKDFKDFQLICRLIYMGVHRTENIKALILKLSLTMNNNRLSTNTKKVELLSSSEWEILNNVAPAVTHLSDGRQIILSTGKINPNQSSCLYEIIKPNQEVVYTKSIAEAIKIVGGCSLTLSKSLENTESSASINGFKVKRIAVFIKSTENKEDKK